MLAADNQLIATGVSESETVAKSKGVTPRLLVVIERRTQPLLIMAIQIPHKHKKGTDNLSSSASMAAIKARKQSKIRSSRSGLW